MSSRHQPRYTPQEYLALERKSEHRSEFLDGRIYAMTGASREHNLIALNVSGHLWTQLRGGPCETYTIDRQLCRPPAPVHRPASPAERFRGRTRQPFRLEAAIRHSHASTPPPPPPPGTRPRMAASPDLNRFHPSQVEETPAFLSR